MLRAFPMIEADITCILMKTSLANVSSAHLNFPQEVSSPFALVGSAGSSVDFATMPSLGAAFRDVIVRTVRHQPGCDLVAIMKKA
ncbi:hypothetical protein ACHAWF_014348 [Thalassiosira exigua]